MNEEKLIETLKECVDYFANKYELGRVQKDVFDDGTIRYIAKVVNSKRFDSVVYEKRGICRDMTFYLGLNLGKISGRKEVSIRIYPNLEKIEVETNDFEDFNYVCNRIKEAMK